MGPDETKRAVVSLHYMTSSKAEGELVGRMLAAAVGSVIATAPTKDTLVVVVHQRGVRRAKEVMAKAAFALIREEAVDA